jgi:hypothetical protein
MQQHHPSRLKQQQQQQHCEDKQALVCRPLPLLPPLQQQQ